MSGWQDPHGRAGAQQACLSQHEKGLVFVCLSVCLDADASDSRTLPRSVRWKPDAVSHRAPTRVQPTELAKRLRPSTKLAVTVTVLGKYSEPDS
jgi:hypothetical protein